MKSQTLILLIVAAGCGLVAMLGVQQVLNKKGEDTTQKIQVLQAAANVGVGEELNDINTQLVAVDIETVPEGAITKLEQTHQRALLIPVTPGDWITEKKLGEPGLTGLTVNIPKGMQVCSIPVDATTSHSGMLQAGHRVDLMMTYNTKNEIGERTKKVRRLLQYVEVYAVDNKVYGINDDGEQGKARNISLLVTPEQALHLEFAKTEGKMSTVLRRNGDSEEVASTDLSSDDLEGGTAPGVNTRSSRDTNRGDEDKGDSAADAPETGLSLLDQLQNEFMGGGSGPVNQGMTPVSEDWTLVIWEGTTPRVETVRMDTDLPTSASEVMPGASGPVQGGFQVPVPPGVLPPGEGGQPGGFEGAGNEPLESDLW